MSGRRKKKGFTLVELLVVTGLMAAMLGLLLVVGRPSEKSNIRRAAQDLSGMLLAVQSRALGQPQGAGVIIAPNSGNSRIATAGFDAITRPLPPVAVTGTAASDTWPPAELTILPRKTSVGIKWTSGLVTGSNAFKLRFQTASGDPVSPWFAFSGSAGLGTVSFRPSAGQTLENTIWPTGTTALFVQCPSPGTLTLSFPKQTAIDLKHSGVGEDPAATHGYGRFEGLGTIAVTYDEVGRLSDVMRKIMETRSASDQPLAVSETVYFLFASQSDISQNQSLASQNSIWVAINPLSGRVTVAENVPQSTEDATALKAARVKAREGSAMK